MIESYIGDINGLSRNWITPNRTGNGWYIPSKPGKRSDNIVVLADGFKRFCEKSGGSTAENKLKYGYHYTCTLNRGNILGTLEIKRVDGNLLDVWFDTPAQEKKRASDKNRYEEIRDSNGPSGWVITNKGKFKFLRLGNLDKRDVIVFSGFDNPVYIDDVSVIEFNNGNRIVTLADGTTGSMGAINKRTGLNSFANYGFGKSGFRVVLVDRNSGQPYTKIFEHFEGIKYIKINPDKNEWNAISAGKIKSSFDITPMIAPYRKKLIKEANLLYTEAEKNGWLLLIPKGNLPPQLQQYLKHQLNTKYHKDCKANKVDGFLDINKSIKCKIEEHESRLIFEQGYSLVTNITPLSTTIILNKIKRDASPK